MVVGIEAAGLVLATLPLFIEVAKAYSHGAETLFNVILHSRRDERLSDFYEEFYWNLSEISQHVDFISRAIRRDLTRPSSMLDLRQWHKSSDVAQCLEKFFRTKAAYNQYLIITERLSLIFALLVERQSLYIKKNEMDEDALFNRLRQFALDRESQRTKSDLMERFRFFKSEKERNRCLQKLETWCIRLEKLVGRATNSHMQRDEIASTLQGHQKAPVPWDSLTVSLKDPIAHVRLLSRDLYTVLSNSWKCSCTRIHEARFCLNLHDSEKLYADVDAQFDFVVLSGTSSQHDLYWKEGTVGARSVNHFLANESMQLQEVCQAVKACMAAYRLRLLMENVKGHRCLWKLDPRPKKPTVLETEPPKSLHNLLTSNFKMGSYEKRELAVICAYSLLLLHDTPWFGGGWSKTSLSFFFNKNNEPNYSRPFISTRFETPVHFVSQTGAGVIHRNSHILALGILFIEIFLEKPIEVWRSFEEETLVSADTEEMINLLVADRIVKKMDTAPSRSAIQSCLDLDWIPQGQEATLEDPQVRIGLFEKVIRPLEAEISIIRK